MSDESGAEFAKIIQAQLRAFFRSTTGCKFAAAHAKEASDSLLYSVVESALNAELPKSLGDFVDDAGERGAAAVVVFPRLRSVEDVCQLLMLLHKNDGWLLTRPAWQRHPRPDVIVGLCRESRSGTRTCLLGLGPFGSMPATRRAPYVSLVAWTGARANPHRREREEGRVGLGDMPLPKALREKDKYREAFQITREAMRVLRSELKEGADAEDITFCLPEECAELLKDA